MKKLIIIVLFMSSFLFCYGQYGYWIPCSEYVKGQITLKDSTILNGYVFLGYKKKRQHDNVYYKKEDKKKIKAKKYTYEEVEKVTVVGKNHLEMQVALLNKTDSSKWQVNFYPTFEFRKIGSAYKILYLVVDGKTKLYSRDCTPQYNPFQTFHKVSSMEGACYLAKEGVTNLTKVESKLSFKSKMKTYFSDCPSLVAKIKRKGYNDIGDLYKMVMDYNDCK